MKVTKLLTPKHENIIWTTSYLLASQENLYQDFIYCKDIESSSAKYLRLNMHSEYFKDSGVYYTIINYYLSKVHVHLPVPLGKTDLVYTSNHHVVVINVVSNQILKYRFCA